MYLYLINLIESPRKESLATELSNSALFVTMVISVCFRDSGHDAFFGALAPRGARNQWRCPGYFSFRGHQIQTHLVWDIECDNITSPMICTGCLDLYLYFTCIKFPDPHDSPRKTSLAPERQFGGGLSTSRHLGLNPGSNVGACVTSCKLLKLSAIIFSLVKWSYSAHSPEIVWIRSIDNVWYMQVLNSISR